MDNSNIQVFDKKTAKQNQKKVGLENNLTSRMQQFKEKINTKIAKLSLEAAEREVKECTFAPKIWSKSGKRSFSGFLNAQLEFEVNRNRKIQEKITEENPKKGGNSGYFTPKLCRNSLNICASQLRLNKEAKQPIDHIYPSALKRSKIVPPAAPVKCKQLVNRTSISILHAKFTKEFNSVYDSLDTGKTSTLAYSLYIQFLQNMHFIVNSSRNPGFNKERNLSLQVWKMINSTDTLYIAKDPLFSLLLRIMELHSDNQKTLRTTFMSLYRTRELHISKRSRIKSPLDFPFKPNLSESSVKLAETNRLNKRSGYSQLEFLVAENQMLIEKHTRMKRENESSLAKTYTFSPLINQTMSFKRNRFRTGTAAFLWREIREQETHKNTQLQLYNLSVMLHQQELEDSQEHIELQKSTEYTFTPNIRQSLHKDRRPTETAKGVDSAILRLQRTRWVKELSNSGF